jgi:uncharacterized cupin superfamily protein
LSWQDAKTYSVRAGDTIVHRVRREAHTLRAGDEGMTFLVFGGRTPLGGAYLPKAGLYWLYPTWTEVGAGEHPFHREQHLEWPEPQAERPENIVALEGLAGDYGGIVKHPGKDGGARSTGLNWVALPANERGAPPHCHSADEEVFVVLDGEGTLELWASPDPENQRPTEPSEMHVLRAGHIVARPPATRVSHSLLAGPNGLTYLAYGTREPNDMCWYPRSNKVFFRGLGVIGRLELLGYADGEPD